MTAIQAMERQMGSISREMNECVTDEGHVKNGHRYIYSRLMTKLEETRDAMIYLKELKREMELKKGGLI